MNSVPQRQMLTSYLLNTCTPAEALEVERWLAKDPENALILQKEARRLRGDKPLPIIEKEKTMASIARRIEADRSSRQTFRTNGAYSNHFNRQLWARAAAMVLIILTVGIGAFYLSRDYIDKHPEKTVWVTTRLSYGKTATLHLGDGSVIKLNGGSTLRYPKTFAENKRVVYLEGEAFFSIAHDAKRAFIVHTEQKTIRDIGTAFNVEAYAHSQLQVAVSEGVVAVSPPQKAMNGDQSIILTKNEWASFKSNGRLLKRGEGDIWSKVAWKEGVLVFDDISFEKAAAMLERWYGVKIVLKDQELKTVILSGEHEGVSLEGVLQSIDFFAGIDYTIKNGVVTIEDDAVETVY